MDIIIFAMISGFLFYKLYNILGTNGLESTKSKSDVIDVTPNKQDLSEKPAITEEISTWPHQLKQIQNFDSKFSERNFLIGAKSAYEMIFDAYNKANQSTLKYLLSHDLYNYFNNEISNNKLNNKQIEKIIVMLNPPIISDITIEENIAYIDVIFKGEQIIKETNLLDKTSHSRKVLFSDNWRFKRDLKSSSPNWQLIQMK